MDKLNEKELEKVSGGAALREPRAYCYMCKGITEHYMKDHILCCKVCGKPITYRRKKRIKE